MFVWFVPLGDNIKKKFYKEHYSRGFLYLKEFQMKPFLETKSLQVVFSNTFKTTEQKKDVFAQRCWVV